MDFTTDIFLLDKPSEVKLVPIQTDIGIPVPETDTLTHILESFYDVWGNCDWTDEDKIKKQIRKLPKRSKRTSAIRMRCSSRISRIPAMRVNALHWR